MVSRRIAVLLVLGSILVTVPLYAPLFDITGEDYIYKSTIIKIDGNELRIPDETEGIIREVDGFDCFRDPGLSRQCILESSLLNGSRRIDHPSISYVTGNIFSIDGDYVSFHTGVVYRRTVDWHNGAFVLGLEQIPARQALQNVSIPLSSASPLLQRAIKTGSVRTNNKLFDTSSIVSVRNQYYLVYYAGTEQFLSEMPFTERLLEAGATIIGAWLLVATGMSLRDEQTDGD